MMLVLAICLAQRHCSLEVKKKMELKLNPMVSLSIHFLHSLVLLMH